ncbi:PH domain-containing protein [Rhodococcus sp. HNM0569]|uniref:PH domain-containing protein n=1 Tax=Rhodococcus sp. HNM0569 TaxID=2716340 RepID=UPI00146D54F1|nr:PH domain-containing protein [Rhodococcus sp. HNM0569]NLU81235.1 PH domain-containing protein [Rhodococcus sp. HNM0569]
MSKTSRDDTATAWETVAQPHKTGRYAVLVAAVLAVVHIVLALLLGGDGTGVYFRAADQFALAGIGLVLALAVLTLARPRLKVSERGVMVRNPFTERVFTWSDVRGLGFPDGAAWARIELPDDEYMSVLALQANDRERAVESVRRFRAAQARFARD